jgi:predicted DCC family thiol-disulfide oxidoreductase YuxK
VKGKILYDSECNLCNRLLMFVRRRDIGGRFIFVPLQSHEGKEMLQQAGLSNEDPDTAVYFTGGKYHLRSGAVLHILKDLGGIWKLTFASIIIPVFIRDRIYNAVARNRYRIFGRREACER